MYVDPLTFNPVDELLALNPLLKKSIFLPVPQALYESEEFATNKVSETLNASLLLSFKSQ